MLLFYIYLFCVGGYGIHVHMCAYAHVTANVDKREDSENLLESVLFFLGTEEFVRLCSKHLSLISHLASLHFVFLSSSYYCNMF